MPIARLTEKVDVDRFAGNGISSGTWIVRLPSNSGREIMDERTAVSRSVADTQVSPNTTPPKKPKRGRWLRRAGLALVVLALGVLFAPKIITSTVLSRRLPKMLVPMVHANVEWSELSLGWFSTVVVKDLKIQDLDGQPLLDVEKISTSHPLWALIAYSQNLGTLKIAKPVLYVSLRNDGSNLEDLMVKFTQTSSSAKASDEPSKSTTVPGIIVEIEDARLDLEHKAANRKASLDQIAFRFVSAKGTIEEVDLTIGEPPADGQPDTTAQADPAQWLLVHYGTPKETEAAAVPSEVKMAVLKASHWKLDWVNPALSRVMAKAELTAEVHADASVELTPNATGYDWDWSGSISIEDVLVSGIDALKSDKLAFEQIELAGRAATTQGRLVMDALRVIADVGEVSATGDIPLNNSSQKSTAELIQSLLSDEDYHIAGNLDLKKLATMLPQTLRIREGIEITGGEVKVQIVGDDSNGVRRWSGVAGVVGLSAMNNGKAIPWDKPLAVRATAHRDQKAVVIDQMECKSDFLQVKGSGTIDDARFTATGDLDKLLENLERFVDLGIEQLSGQMNADCELRRIDEQHVGLNSKILLDNFAFSVSKNNVWREEHLELTIQASGRADTVSGLTQIDTAEAHLLSGGDACDSKVTQPIDLRSTTPTYAIVADVKGNLASWQNRLRPFVAVNDWKLNGTLDLETSITADPQKVQISKFSIGLENLEADGPGWAIQDPEITLETTGEWVMASQKWTSPKASLKGHALAVEIDKLECALGKSGIARLSGVAEYDVDLKQISQWMNDASEKPSYHLLGSLVGKATISQQESVMTAKLDTQIEKLVIAGLNTPAGGKPQWAVLWKEPQLTIGAAGSYDVSADKLTLESSHLDVDGLTVGAQGTLAACSTRQQIDLTGDLAYDWDQLVKRFGESLGQHIQLSGKDHRPFSIKGSLASLSSSPAGPASGKTQTSTVSFTKESTTPDSPASAGGLMDLSGQAGLGWTAANVYGIVAGPADISARLEQGVCQFAPLDITVNEGKLHLTPAVHLEQNPQLLVLPQEKVLDHIRLSPELCSGWLKFVVPALADSAQVEGKFSLDVNGASVPLTAPTMGKIDASLAVHQVQVRPGPLALKIVSAIDQIQTIISRRPLGDLSKDVWLEMPEQHIPFKMEQGRVYHEGLTFTVKNVAVKTSGSVGLDETLQLVAEIPLRDEWLGNQKVFAGLKGQTVRIPINGTLTSPQLDTRVFSNLTQQVGGSVLEGVIKDKVGDKLDNAINDGLNRFLKGKK
jgi:translocation and assembly module TamB